MIISIIINIIFNISKYNIKVDYIHKNIKQVWENPITHGYLFILINNIGNKIKNYLMNK